MDFTRRSFLASLGLTAAGAVMAEKTGLLDKIWKKLAERPYEVRASGLIVPTHTIAELNELFKEVYAEELKDLVPPHAVIRGWIVSQQGPAWDTRSPLSTIGASLPIPLVLSTTATDMYSLAPIPTPTQSPHPLILMC